VKKILMVTDLYPHGGVANWALMVIGNLCNRAIFKVVSHARSKDVVDSEIWNSENVTWHPAPVLSIRHGLAIGNMWRVMRDFRPDYMVCHSTYLAVSLLCARIFIFRHIPLMIVIHGTSIESTRSRYKEHVIHRLINLLLHPEKDAIAAVAPHLEGYLQSILAEKFEISVIPNGIKFDSDNEERIDLDPQCIHLAFVGRLSYEKGPDLFLQVARNITDSRVRYHVIGDGPMCEEIEREVLEVGLDPVFTFHGWLRDVKPYLRAMDALIITSRTEGLPYVVLEAFSCALPVLSFPVGGLPYLMQDDKNGYMCNDVSEMVQIIETDIISERSQSEAKTASALAFLRRELLADKMIDRYRKIWKIK
jgi:glycosyltransferase involved in cell wall biosynthesis